MSDELAKEVVRRQSQLEEGRSVLDTHCQEVAERILPRQNDFMGAHQTPGEKRTEKIFDSTGVLALDRAASAIDSLITPGTSMWHGFEPEDERLREDKEVMVYCDELRRMLFRSRYRPSANFASQAHECYVSLMAFGTLGMFVDDILGIGLRYSSIALVEMYIAQNHAGIVDLVHRKFPLEARQAMQKFGGKLPEKIRTAAEKSPFQKFNFIHCVKPNEERRQGRRDYTGMAFSSYYVAMDEMTTVSQGGYRTMPYLVSRHVTAPRETYGRSPAMAVLPDIKMVNEMEKTIIRAAHRVVSPPLLAYGDGVLSAFSVRPDAINYGGVDEQGRQLVHPMKMGSNLPIALDMTEQKRKVINDAFYVTLFQILVENPRMTATEALIRAQEKGQLLAPTVGRQESEFIGPMTVRELDIHQAGGLDDILPPPRALRRSGGGIKTVYTSPLSRLRRAEDGVSILRTIEGLAPIAQVDPTVYDIFDTDATARELASINGAPAKILRSVADITAIREDRKQQQAITSMLEQAQTAANAAKNLGQAAQAAGSVQLPAGVEEAA